MTDLSIIRPDIGFQRMASRRSETCANVMVAVPTTEKRRVAAALFSEELNRNDDQSLNSTLNMFCRAKRLD